MNYYTISDDNSIIDRWWLGDVNVDDNWVYTQGRRIEIDKFLNLSVEIDQMGIELDYTETNGYSVPVVSKIFAEIFFEYNQFIQLIPVTVPGSKNNFYIFVVNNLIDCVDESRSDFEIFEVGNDIRPDKAGNTN